MARIAILGATGIVGRGAAFAWLKVRSFADVSNKNANSMRYNAET